MTSLRQQTTHPQTSRKQTRHKKPTSQSAAAAAEKEEESVFPIFVMARKTHCV
jgi:hypothetical protein